MKYLVFGMFVFVLSACQSPAGKNPPSEEARNHYSASDALLLAKLSKISYLNSEEVQDELSKINGLRFVLDEFIEDRSTSTEGFLAHTDELLVLAFRGTQEPEDIIRDVSFFRYQKMGEKYCNGKGEIHGGFNLPILNITSDGSLFEKIKKLSKGKKFYITGHSLGGALSIVFAYYIKAENQDIDVTGIYTFGQPIVGNTAFSNCYDDNYRDITYRHINNQDGVPRLKPPSLDFKTQGILVYFGKAGCSQYYLSWSILDKAVDTLSAKNLFDHPINKYIDRLDANKHHKPVPLKNSDEVYERINKGECVATG